MMAIIMLAIWTIGVLLIVTDRNNLASRWAGISACIGGFGFLAATLNDELRPLLPPEYAYGIQALSRIASFICQVGLPYAYLMFAIQSSSAMNLTYKKVTMYLGIIPAVYMLIITPIIPDLTFDYILLSSWAIPFILVGSILLFYLFLREKDPLWKRGRLVIVIVAVIPMLLVMGTIYISRIFGLFEVWKYNALVIFIQFMLFVGFALKYGVLGFKLRIEENQLDTTMRAMTSGSAILNHTIKNEVGKMQLLLYRLKRFADDQPGMNEDLEDLNLATEHMLEMVQRIQGKVQDVELRESVHSVEELVKDAIHQVQPLLDNKSILVRADHEKSVDLWVDSVHIQEVLVNVLKNAIEALPMEGQIRVRSYQFRKYMVLVIEDNGKGIAKHNLPHVMQPFFTTKKNTTTNFGLGLAYCYQVMRKHQGYMEIDSTEEVGTSVFLYFPSRRVTEPERRQ